MEREADVIIVGAGLSGLIAARDVERAGLSALVLEGNDRTGGRIQSVFVDGIPYETGAQWIGDTHHKMFALAAELGVDTFTQYETGETSYEFFADDHKVMREDEWHAKHADELAGLDAVYAKIDELADTVNVQAPWETPNAKELDMLTCGQWMDAQGLGPTARELLEICTVGILSVPTHEVSFLDFLYNIKGCGVTSALVSEDEGGAQTTRFVGGTERIPTLLAEALGDKVLLNQHVQTIEYTDSSVKVISRNGDIARGKQVIVAIAPTLAGRITYDPPLSGIRDQLTQRLPQAHAVKVFAIYDEPFWRADGLNGQLISTLGPGRMSNDSCIQEDAGGPGAILVFLEGEQARTFGRLPEEQLHAQVTDLLGRHFGPKALKPNHVISGEWSNRPFTRGCYNANMGPTTWTNFGQALAAPIGPIKWAATETADYWSAYMEGAVGAGERAAQEVIDSLS